MTTSFSGGGYISTTCTINDVFTNIVIEKNIQDKTYIYRYEFKFCAFDF